MNGFGQAYSVMGNVLQKFERHQSNVNGLNVMKIT